jgi:hypothetical protein
MPLTQIDPSVGFSRSAMTRRNVVLPQPDGPMKETNSPVYAFGLGADRARRVAALGFAVLAGTLLALLPLDLRDTAIGAAGIVAFARGVLREGGLSLRAIALEAAFGAAGLATAGWFARGGLLATCLALWGYFLVQSGFFLITGDLSRAGEIARDPFDRARARLQRLLEDDPI